MNFIERLCPGASSVWVLLICLASMGITQCAKKLPPGDPDNGGLFLPDGFEAVVVTDSIEGRARHLAVNDNGDVYVKLMVPGAGGNIALRDTDNDGKTDIRQPFGDYTDDGMYGTAMRIHSGYLYFSTELVVYRYKLTPGKLIPEGKIEVVLSDDHAHGKHEHITKPISFDDKGNMYVPFGAGSNSCQEINRTPYSRGMDPCPWLEDHGGIWKFDANKTNLKQRDGAKFATGLRSIVAMDWNETDKNLYVVMHGRDDLLRLWAGKFTPWQSAVLPAEEFLRIKEGTDAGWPYCYYDPFQAKSVLAPEYGGDGRRVGKCDQYEKPVIAFPAHWAPGDLCFYHGDQFPDHYKNGAFIAFHGSTNRTPYPQAGYIVAFVPYENGQWNEKWEIFADGFAGVDPIPSTSEAKYRPMGLAVGPDGSLYVVDSEKGKIWRVMYKGEKTGFLPKQLEKMEELKKQIHIRTPDPVEDNLDKGTVVGGAKVYRVYCSTCHQRDGLGATGRFPPIAGSDWVNGNKKRLISILLAGLEGNIVVSGKTFDNFMPQHSFLNDEEIAGVSTFIRQNFGNTSGEVTPEEVAQVRGTLKTKAREPGASN